MVQRYTDEQIRERFREALKSDTEVFQRLQITEEDVEIALRCAWNKDHYDCAGVAQRLNQKLILAIASLTVEQKK